MYGIFTYIYHKKYKNQPNVGKYTIHGSFGSGNGTVSNEVGTPAQTARCGDGFVDEFCFPLEVLDTEAELQQKGYVAKFWVWTMLSL